MTNERKLAILRQADANVTAQYGERPRGGKYGRGAMHAPYPIIDAKAFVADLDATFAARQWDKRVTEEYRRLEGAQA